MSDNKDKPSKSRKIPSKAPPQIVKFFSKPDVASTSSQLNDRKRKLPNMLSTENEDPSTYAQTLKKNAEKISRIEKTKKVNTVVSTFFQKDKNDSLSDFESPQKRVQIRPPPVLPKKKVTRKRKQTDNQNKTKNRIALETEVFEKVLVHHSIADGLSSDDLQMAIALSRSLAETHGSSNENCGNISSVIRNAEPSDKEDIIRTTFQKFGFKKRDNKDYDFSDFFTNIATNKKWTSKFTPLTRRSENMQKEKFKKKVKAILQISEHVENLDSELIKVYQVTSSYLQQFLIPESRTYKISTAVVETKIGDFYTTHLVPVSNLHCGSLLKNWEDIPGRDISPERYNVPSWDDTLLTLETHNEGSSLNHTEKNQETEDNINAVPVVNVLGSTSNSKKKSDNLKLPNADGIVQKDEHFLESDKLKIADIMDMDLLDEIEEKSAREHSPDESDGAMDVDIVARIEARNVREQSPDMFADYDSSANNSFNDDKSTTNLKESFASINSGYLGSKFDDDDNNKVPDKTPTNVPDVGDTNRSYTFENIILEDCPNISLIGCGMNNKESNEIEDVNGSAMVDGTLKSDGIVPQHTAKEVVMLSSVDSNQSFENLDVNNSKPFSETPTYKLASITPIKSVTKHLSFTERLEIYNSDPALKNGDDKACYHRSQSSQDSIVISDDEINYSLNPNPVYSALSGSHLNMCSQESIELSDSEDDNKEINPQMPESDIDERQSFLSLKMSEDSDCVSEKSLDINFDDENFNSNHSLDEEDLINLSVKEMCQKEFVVGSVKPSTTKNFSRTVSDMTFERKIVRKNPTTPEKCIELSDDDDDEFDEFDKLVKGLKNPPWLGDKSIKIRHETNDKIVQNGGNSVCDNIDMLDSSLSPIPSNEFIVQSMDQIYEVRTGILVTPKPDYENMNSPTRLEHLKKYGLKALSKRKAVICLEHIYSRLHPFIELDEHVDIFSQRKVSVMDSVHRNSDVGASQQPTSSTSNIARNIDSIVASNFDVIQENESVFYLPSAPRAKKQWCLQPLHIAWHNLIYSNAKLYDQILQYKPVDIADIRLLFKSIDLRYETNDIISFFDRKCITFKTDNKRNNVAKKNSV